MLKESSFNYYTVLLKELQQKKTFQCHFSILTVTLSIFSPPWQSAGSQARCWQLRTPSEFKGKNLKEGV